MVIYTDDARLSAPSETVVGKAALTEHFKKELESGVFVFNTAVADFAERIGDISHSTGHWTATMKTPDGKEVPVSGHWQTAGGCVGEDCQVTIHMINMQLPPPEAKSAQQ